MTRLLHIAERLLLILAGKRRGQTVHPSPFPDTALLTMQGSGTVVILRSAYSAVLPFRTRSFFVARKGEQEPGSL